LPPVRVFSLISTLFSNSWSIHRSHYAAQPVEPLPLPPSQLGSMPRAAILIGIRDRVFEPFNKLLAETPYEFIAIRFPAFRRLVLRRARHGFSAGRRSRSSDGRMGLDAERSQHGWRRILAAVSWPSRKRTSIRVGRSPGPLERVGECPLANRRIGKGLVVADCMGRSNLVNQRHNGRTIHVGDGDPSADRQD
jgi:hypothetical protein